MTILVTPTRCVDCGVAVSEDEDYVELDDRQLICAVCVDRGVNPTWAGPRDIDRSRKQSTRVKTARAEGDQKYDQIFTGAKTDG